MSGEARRNGRWWAGCLAVLATFAALVPTADDGARATEGEPPASSAPDAVAEAAEELLAAAEDDPDGTVTAIVDLDVPVATDHEPTAVEEQAQEQEIATAQAALADALAPVDGATVLDQLGSTPVAVVQVDAAGIEALAGHPGVAGLHLDVPAAPLLGSSAPAIGAPAAWAEGLDGTGTTVAVIDTGVDRTHPAFERWQSSNRIVAEACFSRFFVTGGGVPVLPSCPGGGDSATGTGAGQPCTGLGCDHGTHVAAIASSRDAASISPGIAHGAELWTINVFGDPAPTFETRTATADVLAALDHVYANRNERNVAAVNLSLGSGAWAHECPGTSGDTVTQQLRAAGIAVVASSGNDGGGNQLSWPACLPAATPVASTDDAGQISSFSDRTQNSDVLLAPGESVLAAVPGGGQGTKSGTSMAAPHVAAAFAILSQQLPAAGVDELDARIRDTARPVQDGPGGPTYPMVDLDAAIVRVPPAPTNLSATTGTTHVQLRWDAPAQGTDPTNEYRIYRDGLVVATVAAGTTSHTLVGLEPGASLRLQVSAVNVAGEGARSSSLAVSLPRSEPSFTDVAALHPFFEAIEWMRANGISVGFGDGTYHPGAPVSRQAMSAFMQRLAGSPDLTPPDEPTFADVPTDHPFFAEIEWMAAQGVSTGYADGTYQPAAPVSRQAMSAFMLRLAGAPPFAVPDQPTFPDVAANHPFYDEVEWMAAAGVTTGFADGTYQPAAPVSRQAMSAFMQRLVPHADEVGAVLQHTGNLPLAIEGSADLQQLSSLSEAVDRPVWAHPDRVGTYGLHGYRCIVLNGNRGTFSTAQLDQLEDYVRAGGTLVTTAEADPIEGALASQVQQTRVLAHLGAAIANVGGNHEPGFQTTTLVQPDPLTAGVRAIRFGRAGALAVVPPARPLLATPSGSAVLAAAQDLGAGQVVALSDMNVLSDRSDTGYQDQDNGRLARNLCG